MRSVIPKASSAQVTEVNLKQHILSGGAWAVVCKGGTAIVGLVGNALLARLLAPEELGAYFLTFSVVAVGAVVTELGFNQAVVRLVAESMSTERPGRAARTLQLVFRLAAISAMLIGSVTALWAGAWIGLRVFDSPMMAGISGLLAVWIVVMTFQDLLAESFRSMHDIKFAETFHGLFSGGISALLFAGLWMVHRQSTLTQVVVLSIAAGLTSNFTAGLLLRTRLRGLKPDNGLAVTELLRIAWPLWITSLMLYVLSQADLWILGAFRSAHEVALYAIAARIVVLVGVPVLITNAVLAPIIAGMYARGRTVELERTVRTTTAIAAVPALAVLVGCILWGGSVLRFGFGEAYTEASPVLIVLAIGQFVRVLAGPSGLVLMMSGHQTLMFGITTVSGVIAVAGALWLVTPYGVVGVASIVAAVTTMHSVCLLLGAHRTTRIWTHVPLPW